MPTQVPIGSILLSFEYTAIFDLEPGSRAADLIDKIPSSISGTSFSKSLIKKLGEFLVINNCEPLLVFSTPLTNAFILSPTLRFSLGIIWSLGRNDSNLPVSMIAPNLSIFLIDPYKMDSFLSKKSFKI